MSTSTLTRARTRFPSSLLVAVGLAVGFGVAQGTGNRPLGGAVFAAAGLAAGWLCRQRRGWKVAAGLGALYLGAFVLAHVLAIGLGDHLALGSGHPVVPDGTALCPEVGQRLRLIELPRDALAPSLDHWKHGIEELAV